MAMTQCKNYEKTIALGDFSAKAEVRDENLLVDMVMKSQMKEERNWLNR